MEPRLTLPVMVLLCVIGVALSAQQPARSEPGSSFSSQITNVLVATQRAAGVIGPSEAATLLSRQISSDPTLLNPGMNPREGRVGIDVAVTDAQGNAVTGLPQSDFRLLDEGRPRGPVSFAASSATSPAPGDPPVSIILVLDEADLSPADRVEAQSDVKSFLRNNGGRLTRPVTEYRVTSEALCAAGPSRDGNALADLIDWSAGMRQVWDKTIIQVVRGPTGEIELGSQPSDRSTSLPKITNDHVSLPIALKALGAIALEQRQETGRKLLFWIGPGWRIDLKGDKRLFDTITEFYTRLREARIELSIASRWPREDNGPPFLTNEQLHQYASGVPFAQDSNYDNLALQVFALHTGGMVTGQPGPDNIQRLVVEHIAEASNYYRLTFDPPQTQTVDEYHRLNVELAKTSLTAHTVAGYYNEPVFYDQPSPALDEVTAVQLEQRLAHKESDRRLAGELAGLRLSERFNTPRLVAWLKRMPGSRSREALTALADLSVFLPPPAGEVLPMLPPDQATREVLLERVADFVARLTPRLPNFYAERDTVQYGEPPPKRGQTWKTAQQDRKLYYEVTRADHIYFEDGKERTAPQKLKVTASTRHSLETTGTFGPILVLALKAATSQAGTLIWSHWEKSPEGPLAVFQYLAPPDMQLYGVGFCCMAVDDGMLPFHRNSAFRGELAVHPATGHIVRLTVEADLEPTLPLEISAIMVEYGQVDMGGKTYVCPLRSVSMSRHRRLWELNEWGRTFKIYGPFETVLNDVTFNRYHLFSSQTTIMPGFVPVPQ